VSGGKATLVGGASLAHELQRRLHKRMPPDDLVETQAVRRECLALAALVRTLLEQGHGGTIVFVPTEDGLWRKSLSFAFRFEKPNFILRNAVRGEIEQEQERNAVWMRLQQSPMSDDLKAETTKLLPGYTPAHEGALAHVASLGAVDGALVLTPDLRVLGFGAKLGANEVPKLVIGGPEPGRQRMEQSAIEQAGGTRHQSAIRFIGAHHDCVAVVVSHDRHVSFMFWSNDLEAVVQVRNAHWWE
jgi:hypothetical protein